MGKHELSDEFFEQLFQEIDADHSGSIETSELAGDAIPLPSHEVTHLLSQTTFARNGVLSRNCSQIVNL